MKGHLVTRTRLKPWIPFARAKKICNRTKWLFYAYILGG